MSVFALSLAGAANAQATGTLIKGRTPSTPVMTSGSILDAERGGAIEQAVTTPEALEASRSLAACVARRERLLTARLLAADNVEKFKAGRTALGPTMVSCVGTSIAPSASAASFKFSNRSLVKLLSEATLRQGKPPTIAAAAPSALLPERPWLGGDVASRETELLATCLVNVQPEWTSYLVVTKPASPEEAKGWAEVIPSINECLTNGVTLKTSKSQLRLALADVVYRRTHGAVPAKAGE